MFLIKKLPRCDNSREHDPRRYPLSDSQTTVPYGYCQCGCGAKTPVAKRTRSGRGQFKGEPYPYLGAHAQRVDPIGYEIDPTSGCWNWTKGVKSNGYGVVRSSAVAGQVVAHRFMYEQKHGKVPRHLDLDHLCRNRKCVNPEHLEPVSRSENLRRGARGKMTLASIFQLRLLDASTSLPREDQAEIYGISTTWVTRYLGSNGKGRNREVVRRWKDKHEEHRLMPSRLNGGYPRI